MLRSAGGRDPARLWIGGPPRTGKTMLATRLAWRHGLRWACDADVHLTVGAVAAALALAPGHGI